MTDSEFRQRTCPVCGSDAPHIEVGSSKRGESLTLEALRPYWSGLFKEKVFFSYARCGGCGLLYAPTYFSDPQLGELYADMAPNMELVPGPALEATQASYWKAAKTAGALDGGYLEIGPDVGFIARLAAKEANFEHFWLFEPNRAVHGALAEAVGEKPHTISTEMTDLSVVPDDSVGLAVMIHVLDHLTEPRKMLEKVVRKLRPGGALVIVTHNEGSTLRRVMGVKWPPFCLQHPELYNPNTMRMMLTRAGYAKADVQRSLNYFPISFMVRQAGYTVGIDLKRLPLPSIALGLKLGNMLTIAHR